MPLNDEEVRKIDKLREESLKGMKSYDDWWRGYHAGLSTVLASIPTAKKPAKRKGGK